LTHQQQTVYQIGAEIQRGQRRRTKRGLGRGRDLVGIFLLTLAFLSFLKKIQAARQFPFVAGELLAEHDAEDSDERLKGSINGNSHP